jgi:hypothetical protein
LEVKREIVGARNEDIAMAETDAEGGDVGGVLEEAEWHHGVAGEFPFIEDEEPCNYDAKDDEANHLGRFPWIDYAAEFETEEEH